MNFSEDYVNLWKTSEHFVSSESLNKASRSENFLFWQSSLNDSALLRLLVNFVLLIKLLHQVMLVYRVNDSHFTMGSSTQVAMVPPCVLVHETNSRYWWEGPLGTIKLYLLYPNDFWWISVAQFFFDTSIISERCRLQQLASYPWDWCGWCGTLEHHLMIWVLNIWQYIYIDIFFQGFDINFTYHHQDVSTIV